MVATVTQNKTYWSSENVANAYEETQNCVSAPDLTAGTWEGTFQVEIRLETMEEQEHVHNYVDGKCECGAIDPNHTHNYEDGTCTICGEKDSYTVAPAEAYSKWNYTLDDTNNTITLNYYAGSETDVIVYANYEIGGKTYKTQIASNLTPTLVWERAYMFNSYKYANCKNIQSITFSKDIDTSNVTNMNCMFYGCSSLSDLDLGNLDTSNVTSMHMMFYGCSSLPDLDVSNFNTGSVTNMQSMFRECTSLSSIDLSSFNTSNVKDMTYMFDECTSLTSLDLSSFDTSSVTNMRQMFEKCKSLTNLDLSSFDTSNVKEMPYMFSECTSLDSLDLSSFDTKKVTNMLRMFWKCSNLKTIYVTKDKWSTTQADILNMFESCGTSSVTYK